MKGYRKGHNPIVNGLKAVGEGIGKGLEAMAEAAREEEARQIELRQIEAGYRSTVEDAIREYEKNVGRPFQMGTRFDPVKPAPIAGYNTALPWDPERRGHLMTCRDNCHVNHCLTCGMESYGQVYCFNHRP